MYELDQDLRLSAIEPGRFQGTVSDRWNIGSVPNGGYVMSIAMAALRQELEAPDPLSVTAHFLRPAAVGPAEVGVETIKVGRTTTTAMATLVQERGEVLRLLASYGDLAAMSGPTHVAAVPPELPPRDAAPPASPSEGVPEIAHRFDQRPDPSTVAWAYGKPSGEAVIKSWVRFADGRPPCVHSLALFADALAPPVFNVITPGWVPTIELTVHVRARPRGEWLRAVFRTRFLFGGLLEEDGELWDEGGQLVALSRQLAVVPRG